MKKVRAGPGCVNYENTVYVLDGAGECHHLRELEVGRVDTMADMIEKHSWFTPAVLAPCIYLCGGNTSHCEVFDLATETCVDMRISLPHSLEACAFAYNQDLIVLQRG